MSKVPDGGLICPGCGAAHPAAERFCEDCGLPLVHEQHSGRQADPPVAARRRAARKIDPRYTEGEPVKVVGARNQTEAEFIQGLLLEEGIPSMLRRARGFDVADFLAAGPRDVLVPASGAVAAREVLLQSELISEPSSSPEVKGWRVMAWLLAGLALAAILLELIVKL